MRLAIARAIRDLARLVAASTADRSEAEVHVSQPSTCWLSLESDGHRGATRRRVAGTYEFDGVYGAATSGQVVDEQPVGGQPGAGGDRMFGEPAIVGEVEHRNVTGEGGEVGDQAAVAAPP